MGTTRYMYVSLSSAKKTDKYIKYVLFMNIISCNDQGRHTFSFNGSTNKGLSIVLFFTFLTLANCVK